MSARAYGLLLVGFILRAQVSAAQSAAPSPELPLRVTVDAVGGCPDRAAFFARVRSYAPRVREAIAGEPARTMRVVLRAEGEEFLGTLRVKQVDGEEGSRQVRGADCGSAIEGLAFVAAVIMDPDVAQAGAGASASRSLSSAARPGEPRATRESVLSPASIPAPIPRGPPVRLSAGAAIEVAEGLGIDPESIARVFIDLEFPGLLRGASLRAGAGRGFASSVNAGSTTASFVLTDLRVEPCLAIWSKAPLSLLGCGVLQVLTMSGQAESVGTTSQADSNPSVELGLALRPMWTLGDRIAVGLLLGAAAPTARYRFYFSPSETTVYRLAAWSGFGQFSAGVYFW
ncbi:MAG TPA: hypothetical protein VGY54_28300 [Polyangiaceae bacterium]|jgi:hypothetical protein|nr:hypothetical protein [Polyangiaceae bacterium]